MSMFKNILDYLSKDLIVFKILSEHVQEYTRLPVKGLIVFKIMTEHVQEYTRLTVKGLIVFKILSEHKCMYKKVLDYLSKA